MITGLEKAIQRQFLRSAMLIDGSVEITIAAAQHQNPDFFRLIFNDSDALSIHTNSKHRINGAFYVACSRGRFDTMKLLVNDAEINSK